MFTAPILQNLGQNPPVALPRAEAQDFQRTPPAQRWGERGTRLRQIASADAAVRVSQRWGLSRLRGYMSGNCTFVTFGREGNLNLPAVVRRGAWACYLIGVDDQRFRRPACRLLPAWAHRSTCR